MTLTLTLIFFLSGVAALIFEALWFRLVGLSLGNSVWSASLVLAAFMGGLALGNGLMARVHRRVRRPILLYAKLEFAIGAAGILVVLLLPQLPGLMGPTLSDLTGLPSLLNSVRLIAAFLILVVPATAMGATLPVLSDALSRVEGNFGVNIGRLYGWNTLGAMLGALCTELFLVQVFGLLGSGFVAMSLNLLAALIALRLSQDHEAAAAETPTGDTVARVSPRARWFLLVGFISGAVMLALEVVWFRFLLLTHHGTALIFAVMLAVVLAGIALGGLLAARLFRRDEHAHRWLRHLLALSAALTVGTYAGYDLFTVYQIRNDTTVKEFAAFAIFLMLPVAILSGIAFTMVARAVKEELHSSLRSTGIATLWNTVGAMLGPLVAGFILLPMAGMEWSFFILALAYALTALIVPASQATAATPVHAWSMRGALVAAAAALVLFPFGLMQRSFFVIVEASLPNQQLVAAREGLTETVRYYRRELFGEPHFYRLVTNGYSMSATTTHARRYMKLYVYLPLALQPAAKDALLISYGVGSTAKALTDSTGLEHIDVVDISREILELSSVIYPGDNNPLRDERVKVHVEDGRFFLNTTPRRYDLITAEPPPPKIAGVVNLYSQEYFELLHSRLNPGGYASYWLPVHHLTPNDTGAIIKAFCQAFDDCSLWSGGGLEWMLLGSNGAGTAPDVAGFSAQWRDPVVQAELTALGFETPAQMGSLFMADTELLAQVTAQARPVTDNFPLRISAELFDPAGPVPVYAALMDERERLQRFRDSPQIARIWPAELRQAAEPYFEYERLIKNHFTKGVYQSSDDPFLWEAIDNVLNHSELTTLPLWLLGTDRDAQDIVTRLVAAGKQDSDFALELALKEISERNYAGALTHTERHLQAVGNTSVGVSSLYLYLLARNDRLDQAQAIAASLERQGVAEMNAFIGWYRTNYGLGLAARADEGDQTIR